MRPKEHRESGEHDLFRSRLDQIIDMDHALVKLAGSIDWHFLEQRLGAVYTDKPGHPPLPTRLRLAILKHMHNLSDEVLATVGWRIRTSSTPAARSSSNIGWCSIAPR